MNTYFFIAPKKLITFSTSHYLKQTSNSNELHQTNSASIERNPDCAFF